MQNKKKILFIASGPAAPGTTKSDNPFYYLSEYCTGYVIGSSWPEKNLEQYVSSIENSFGDFKYSAFKYSNFPSFLRQFVHIYNYIKIGSKILREQEIDLIISYGFLAPGISSALLSKFFKKPLLVEVPGVPHKAIKFTNSKFKKLAKFVLENSIKLTLSQAKSVWFLFNNQLEDKYCLKNKNIFVAHDFAPVSLYQPKEVKEEIISFIGYPWDLKGVDILIKAFHKISKNFPNAKLKIAGHCPDRTPYLNLIHGIEDRVEFFKGMEREACVDFIRSTRIFVLPSRTEAMGRVLLEAMSAQKTIIGSNVDGIPHYIKNDKNGLLFESENINDLANKLTLVLNDRLLAENLAKQARKSVMENYTEQAFARNISNFINVTLENK